MAQETVPGDATVYLRSASDGKPLSISGQPRTSEQRGNIVRNYALDRLGSATALVDQSDALSATTATTRTGCRTGARGRRTTRCGTRAGTGTRPQGST